MYYSQFGEDRVLAEIFNKKMVGTCVEVGANDGRHGSTTLHFEERGWSCVLVEPNPLLCTEIRRFRSASLFECGASDQPGEAILFVAEGAEHADGVSMIGDAGVAAKRIEGFGFTTRQVKVLLRTLDSILEEAAVQPGFEFVTIDVEGLEHAVLRGFDLNRWRPRIVIVEDNSDFADRSIHEHMSGQGYVAVKRTGVNDWYVRKEDSQLAAPADVAAYRRLCRQTMQRNRLRKFASIIPGVLPLLRWARRGVLR